MTEWTGDSKIITLNELLIITLIIQFLHANGLNDYRQIIAVLGKVLDGIFDPIKYNSKHVNGSKKYLPVDVEPITESLPFS